ncbi:MAG: alpha/beta hydrolase [Anaerolineae bacterium]|nr:alpha/beta hydrolase [Anaerolineae bacterium]
MFDLAELTTPRAISLVLGILVVGVALLGARRVPVVQKYQRLIVVIGAALIFVGLVGTYQPRMALERVRLILTGGLVDVGGYYLRIECWGEGTPTVVMDAGMSQDRTTWGQVPEGIAKFTRVCIYDRAGVGESDNGPRPRTSERIVQELDALIRNSNITGPLVLVGHSFGGANARLYASQHPAQVQGLVLVDSVQEDEIERYAELIPPEQQLYYLKEHLVGLYESIDIKESLEQVRAAKLPPSIRLTVVAAGNPDEFETRPYAQIHQELQETLARLVPDAKLVIASRSGHFIQMDEPELIVQQVHEMVNRVRADMQVPPTR